MLSKVKGEDVVFKPHYFVCDEGGANYKAICEVYGDKFCKERVKGCQWHFKCDIHKQAQKVGVDKRDWFEEICNEMCCIMTVAGFNMLMAKLKKIAEEYPELQGFVAYWEPWKSHIFEPFRAVGYRA